VPEGRVPVATELVHVEARERLGRVLLPLRGVGLHGRHRFGIEPAVDRLGDDRLFLCDLREQLAGFLVAWIELEGSAEAVPGLVHLPVSEVRLTEEAMSDRLLRGGPEDGHHLRPHLVVTLQGEQSHAEENPHLGHGWPGEENSPASADRLLIAALGDQLLGAGGQVLDRGAHRVRQG
jgi:hypothetical protein